MKLDLHVHSCHSCHSNDSNSKVIDIINKAVKKGLNGIAITDHHTFAGSREALEVNPYPSFLIIPGTEYRTKYGHVQGLFIRDELNLEEGLRDAGGFWPFDAVVEEIHRQGGIAVLAHPFKNNTELPEVIWSRVDAVEVYNSGQRRHWLREIGSSYLEIALDKPGGEKLTLDEVKAAILSKKASFQGSGTPPWYQSFSQMVQIQKTRKYLRLPKILAKLVISTIIFLCRKK